MRLSEPRFELGMRGVLGVLFGLGLCGCVSEGGASVSESEARQQRAAAESSRAVPVQMFLTVSAPRDADGDRFVDTIPVTLYLFPQSSESALPVWSTGEFSFALRSRDGVETLAEWTFSEEAAKAARVSRAPGPGYAFFLRLPEGQDAKLEGTGNLYGIFTHVTGLQASSQGGASVRLGNHLRTP